MSKNISNNVIENTEKNSTEGDFLNVSKNIKNTYDNKRFYINTIDSIGLMPDKTYYFTFKDLYEKDGLAVKVPPGYRIAEVEIVGCGGSAGKEFTGADGKVYYGGGGGSGGHACGAARAPRDITYLHLHVDNKKNIIANILYDEKECLFEAMAGPGEDGEDASEGKYGLGGNGGTSQLYPISAVAIFNLVCSDGDGRGLNGENGLRKEMTGGFLYPAIYGMGGSFLRPYEFALGRNERAFDGRGGTSSGYISVPARDGYVRIRLSSSLYPNE